MGLDPLDAAYLAGPLDGEGTIGVRPRKDGYLNLELGICMTTPAPLYWAKEVTGRGNVYRRKKSTPNRRTPYFWKVGAVEQIAEILYQVRPHMRVKHTQASAFLVLTHLRRAGRFVEGERMIARLVTTLKETAA